VHIHDIFIPNDYPENRIDINYFWSEPYLIMAFLMYNQELIIKLAAQHLSQRYRDKLNSLFPRVRPEFSPRIFLAETKIAIKKSVYGHGNTENINSYK